ncbi:hypothetical protein E2C01_001074 [Portunus trituberculatus]|uniref:Uncharacterized protein n=1 Tax=Portunus trituberculatus TaxID=210409 RepID=A0A5B7CGA4_PORTR|nr:hypothetical protein [Portunus trituberculatus]
MHKRTFTLIGTGNPTRSGVPRCLAIEHYVTVTAAADKFSFINLRATSALPCFALKYRSVNYNLRL